MRWIYLALQVAIFIAVFWASLEFSKSTGQTMGGPAVGFMSIGFAVIATALLYWSIRGIKRLLGHPPEGRLIPPRGAFDNLRSPPRKHIEED